MKLKWKKNWWGKIFSSHVSSNSCRILLLFSENQKMVVKKTLYIYISCPTISFQSNIFYDYTKSLICAIFLLCVNTPTFDPLLRQTHTQTHTHTQYTRTQAHTRTRTHIHTRTRAHIHTQKPFAVSVPHPGGDSASRCSLQPLPPARWFVVLLPAIFYFGDS